MRRAGPGARRRPLRAGRGAQRAGLKVEDIVLCQPDSGEMALEVVDQLVRSGVISLIAVDSVAALVPRAEIEGEIGAVQGALGGAAPCCAAPCCATLCRAVRAGCRGRAHRCSRMRRPACAEISPPRRVQPGAVARGGARSASRPRRSVPCMTMGACSRAAAW